MRSYDHAATSSSRYDWSDLSDRKSLSIFIKKEQAAMIVANPRLESSMTSWPNHLPSGRSKRFAARSWAHGEAEIKATKGNGRLGWTKENHHFS